MVLNKNAHNFDEEKQLMNGVLERHHYKKFRNGEGQIELFLTGACKADCDYCYLKKHQKHLYPIELHNNQQILNNLQMILDWYIENGFTCVLDIFSAEWITTPLADGVFEIFINTFSKVSPKQRPKVICAADNMQFLKNDAYTEKLENYIKQLSDLGIYFFLSASIDGKYCDYGRTENDDEYYKKLNNFMVKHNYRAHPMISSDNIKYWIDNYMWWQQNFDSKIANGIMTLEVRNETWSPESINDLIRYCDFLTDYTFIELFKCDKLEFLKYIFDLQISEKMREIIPRPSYNVIGMLRTDIENNLDHIGCSFYASLPIRVGDLSIGLCHRTWYPQLQIAKFVTENNKIIDLDPVNVALLVMKTNLKRTCLPHCENCKFVGVCPGHCLGSSYEEYGNMLVPQKEVCNMYQAKYTFLLYKYKKMGLFEYLDEIESLFNPEYYCYIKDLINSLPEIENNEEEEELNE